MKKFILFFTGFFLLLLISFLLVFFKANGRADPYYIRFATPKQSSLILGSSRAAQGLQPDVLNKQLSRNDVFNFSFAINLSPYGPTYLESIKRKIDTSSKKGIFILTIDPWSICGVTGNTEDTTKFRERDLALGTVNDLSTMPNINYLINGYDQHYWELLVSNSNTLLHKDGWLEVNVPMDSVSLRKRREKKVQEYMKNNLLQNKFSQKRSDYFIQTIRYLKQYGDVYIVRLPMHPLIMNIEKQVMPDFAQKIAGILKETGVTYFDMTYLNDSCVFTDGNHLYKESGKTVTEAIAAWILQQGSRNAKAGGIDVEQGH